MDWTVERVAKLAELWQSGLSASQVARQLGGGLSRNAVIGKIHRMGLKARIAPSRPRAVAGASSERARRPSSAIPRSIKRTDRVFTPRLPTAELDPTANILTLTHAACRWPIGDPRETDFGYCGRSQSGAGPYCQHHTQVAFRGPLAPRPAGERRARPMHSGSRSPIRVEWR